MKGRCLDAARKQEDVSLKDSVFSLDVGVKLHGVGTKQPKIVPVDMSSNVLTDNCCV